MQEACGQGDSGDSPGREKIILKGIGEMDREQYESAKVRLEEVTRRLRSEQMSDEQRSRLEKEGGELARAVMSPWVPFGWGQRLGMIVIAAIGLWGVTEEKHFLVLMWLALPFFSPRVVGEILNLLTGFKKEGRN
jgi:hypothetical protein